MKAKNEKIKKTTLDANTFINSDLRRRKLSVAFVIFFFFRCNVKIYFDVFHPLDIFSEILNLEYERRTNDINERLLCRNINKAIRSAEKIKGTSTSNA